MRTRIVQLILASLEDLRDVFENPMLEFSEQTVLYGPASDLDSMGLVTLLLEVEQRIEEQLDVTVRLMDEKAMSQKHSPFRTVQSLADYIYTLVGEQNV